MRRSLPSFGLLVLSPLLVLTSGCNRMDVAFNAAGPAPLTANVNASDPFAVEPATLRPDFLHGACGAHSPFGFRIGISFRGGDDIILRGVRFSFVDRSGSHVLPDLFPIASLASAPPTMPSTSPVTMPGIAPLPAASPVSIPGVSPITGVLVPAGAHRRFDFFLGFGCLVFSPGEVIVVIETADRRGLPHSSRIRVVVGA